MKMKKPTMRDIGKAVGVSAVTVSKAMAGKTGMSDAMREKILQTAREMGYSYPGSEKTAVPRNLDIGILVPEAFFGANTFYANMYKRLVQKLTENGMFALLELVEREAEEGLKLPKILDSHHVRGLIMLGQPKKEYCRFIAGQGIPTVFLDFYDEQASADAVVGDNTYGCYRLTSHLIKNFSGRLDSDGSGHGKPSGGENQPAVGDAHGLRVQLRCRGAPTDQAAGGEGNPRAGGYQRHRLR